MKQNILFYWLEDNERLDYSKCNEVFDYNPSADRHIKKSVNQIKDEHLAKARTMEYKKSLEKELLATKEQLQKASNQLRNAMKEQNKVLVEKVSNLEEKINSSPNMKQYEHYKKQFEVRNSILEKTNTEFGLEPKGNLRKLVTFFKNTINEMKEKISNLFKRNEKLEAENKDLKEQIYELKRDRIIESGKANPHEAIRKTLEHAGLTSKSISYLEEFKEHKRKQKEKESPFKVSESASKYREN